MKLIILDRDGVINVDSEGYIKSPAEWQPIPGSLEAIKKLHYAGYHIVVLTNQSGIARGLYSLETLEKIHEKMIHAVEAVGGKIDKIYFCPHGPNDNCNCRKPKTGMFDQIKKDFQIDLSEVYFIGDKYNDYLSAQNADCKFILVKTGYGKIVLEKHPELKEKVMVAENLFSAVVKLTRMLHADSTADENNASKTV